MLKKPIIIFISFIYVVLHYNLSYAAVGCTLNDPDRDVKRIFPDSTGYRTKFMTIKEHGGEALAERIEERLGDKFDSVYESSDVPYAYYIVLKGKIPIGYIHGVNQKGTYGGMQLILATDLGGKIKDFYYQKLSSPEGKLFKSKNFTSHFIGMTLEDFEKNSIKNIKNPSGNKSDDYFNTLRGLKKNMILFDEFGIKR